MSIKKPIEEKGNPSLSKVFVLDLETAGFNPYDAIVEIGGVIVDLETKVIIPAIHEIIYEEDKKIKPNAWIFENTTLSFEEVQQKGVSIESIRDKLQSFFNTYYSTAFNQKFDFSFLRARKFIINHIAPDPMLVAKDLLKIKHATYGFKFPKVQECLDYFKVKETEEHRALSDAIQEGGIVLELAKLKLFTLR